MASVNEEIAERVRKHVVNLMRFEASVRREVLTILEGVSKGIVGELSGSGLSPSRQDRLRAVLGTVGQIIGTAYTQMANLTGERLGELAELESEYTVKTLGDTIPVEVETTSLSPTQLRTLAGDALIDGAITKDWFAKQSEDLRFAFAKTLREGLAMGEDTAKLVRRVRGYKAKDGTEVKGVMEVSKVQAETLVRTAVQQVANSSALASFQANSDLIKAVQQISTLDSRTSVTCVAYSGKQWDVQSLSPIGHDLPFNAGPPRHWRCRSRLVPITKSWKELGFDQEEVPPSKRASMDGEVPADLPLNKWLEGKSDAFIEDLLGPGRAKLWKSGTVSLTNMVGQDGRPLSIKALRDKYGL